MGNFVFVLFILIAVRATSLSMLSLSPVSSDSKIKATPEIQQANSPYCEYLQQFKPSVCTNSIDYNVTIRPNLFGHSTQQDSYEALAEYAKIFGNAEKKCLEVFELFVCALYLPQCVIVAEPADQPAVAMNTCYHTLCTDARYKCQPWLSLFGLTWPAKLDCERILPSDPPDCFYPASKSTQEKIPNFVLDEMAETTSISEKLNSNFISKKNIWQPLINLTWIRVNVGGTLYLSTLETFCRSRKTSTVLKQLFECETSNKTAAAVQEKVYQIDRDGAYFRVILNYLRTGKLILDSDLANEGVLEEANYFNLTMLARLVRRRIRRKHYLAEIIKKCGL